MKWLPLALKRETYFWLVVAVLSAVAPWFVGAYLLHFLYLFLMFAALAHSWNIGALCGIVSLGHIGFFGWGAYVFALLHLMNVPLVIRFVLGGVASATVALAFSPILRLRGAYFAIVSLGFPVILSSLIRLFPEVTGGGGGVALPVRGPSKIPDYYLMLILLALAMLTMHLLNRSKYKLALDAIFDDEDVASMMGVSSFKVKTFILVVSSFFAGIAGAGYAYTLPYIAPEMVFRPEYNQSLLLMSFFGGIRTILGPLIGVFLLLTISETLVGLPYLNLIIYGTVLILGVLFFPGGLLGYFKKILGYFKKNW